jgi:hypothetical protein
MRKDQQISSVTCTAADKLQDIHATLMCLTSTDNSIDTAIFGRALTLIVDELEQFLTITDPILRNVIYRKTFDNAHFER